MCFSLNKIKSFVNKLHQSCKELELELEPSTTLLNEEKMTFLHITHDLIPLFHYYDQTKENKIAFLMVSLSFCFSMRLSLCLNLKLYTAVCESEGESRNPSHLPFMEKSDCLYRMNSITD
ncbi:cytochrome P450 [Striga asiatica]|uniref:Cytochrome P450 n=1 Tax=Striga asiatica TaxID=4170 RepID=A0A5A7RCA0_STRAF|nr:cytochrome P450 [Striga asiatica]